MKRSISTPCLFEVLEIDEGGEDIVFKIDEELGEFFLGRRGFVESDMRDAFDKGEGSLFVTFTHGEDGGTGERIGKVGLFHDEFPAEEVRFSAIVSKPDESSVGKCDTRSPAAHRCGVAVGDENTYPIDSETFFEGVIDGACRLLRVFRKKDICSGRIAFIDAGRSDEGVVDDSSARSEATIFFGEKVISFGFDERFLVHREVGRTAFAQGDDFGADGEDGVFWESREIPIEKLQE